MIATPLTDSINTFLTETNRDQKELREEYTGNRLPTTSYKSLVLDDFSRELQPINIYAQVKNDCRWQSLTVFAAHSMSLMFLFVFRVQHGRYNNNGRSTTGSSHLRVNLLIFLDSSCL